MTGIINMSNLGSFNNFVRELPEDDTRMPVLFVGHGSPMNGIEDNEFSLGWERLGKEIPEPRAVLCISAHWLTNGTHVTAMERPKTIHDFGGFPKALYEVEYGAPGDPTLAKETASLIQSTNVGLDHDWGLDHGCWSVVRRMYPEAKIPVLQMSIDYYKPASYHYALAQELAALRRRGVLIMGSGNMVHNLRMMDFEHMEDPGYGYDWAIEMNDTFKRLISSKQHQPLLNYEELGPSARLAIPTPDHYYPLIYALGLQENQDEAEFFNDRAVGGSFTMTSVKLS
jgi:4,5-DOPA dioxygenase extradiol